MPLWFLLLASCLAPRLAAATPPGSGYVMTTWEIEQGLPENSATAMVQTEDGYLWFGTFNGLVRFDGVRFRVYRPDNTPGLPGRGVVALHLDRSGRLWAGTMKGLAVREGDRWRRIAAPGGGELGPVRSIAERPDGALLFTTFSGNVFTWSGDTLDKVVRPAGRPAAVVTADGQGRWWVSAAGMICRWDAAAGSWSEVVSFPTNLPNGCGPARDGGVWVVAGRELRKYAGEAIESSRRLPEQLGPVWAVTEDSRGNVWIATNEQGVFRMDPVGSVEQWSTRNGLPHNGVRFVFEDRERNIWVGTSGGGLSRFRAARARTFGHKEGLSDRNVKSVWPQQDGGVLVATYGGGAYRLEGGVARQLNVRAGTATSTIAQSIMQDSTGGTWIGTYGQGLFMTLDDRTSHIGPDLLGGTNVIAIFEDSIGRVWVSGGNGVAVVASGSQKVYTQADQGQPLSNVCAFAEDPDGGIVVSSLRGVFRFDGEAFRELPPPVGSTFADVLCLKVDPDGTIWMGTTERGVHRYRAGRLTTIGAAAGLPDAAICGIIDDRRGGRWLATTRGVLRTDHAQLEAVADGRASRIEYTELGVEDGLASIECSAARQPMCGVAPDGRLWFATLKGVSVVDPAAFEVNTSPPRVLIEEVTYLEPAAGRSGARERTASTFERGVTLPPGSRRLEIRYTAPSFANPARVRFEAWLDGLDEGWHDVGSNRSILYYDLPAGDYTFRLRAANEDGVWSEAAAELPIVMTPHIWQTAWFASLGVLSMFGIGAGSAWWITRARVERRRRADEQFRLVVEAAPSAIVLVDRAGSISLVNSRTEHEFGWPRDELIGMPIETLIRGGLPADSDHTDPGAAPKSTMREVVGIRSRGEEIPLEIATSQVPGRSGASTLISMVNVAEQRRRDLELRRQRDEFVHLSRVSVLGELSGALAHELNQPLAAILSNAQAAQQLIVREPVDVPELCEILTDIVEQNIHAGEVIHRLRALLRKGESQMVAMDVCRAVRDVLRVLRSDLIEHGVQATFEPGDVPPVRGDRVQIQQLLINLVKNACEAMSTEPIDRRRLTIEVRPAGTRVEVSVSDSGPGIPPDVLDRLFDPFFTTKARGMGLGLSVGRTIIEAHGGWITARNQPEGGASFTIDLPVADGGPDGD